MNTDNFLIENSDIELAQNICKLISDSNIRNRAVANALAAGIAVKYFNDDKFKAEADSGLHNIGRVLEDIDISDLYVNNCYIDVRIFFSEEELSVPVSHFEDNLLPIAYMFIKITPDLSGADVVGFIKPEDINKHNFTDGYYHINEEDLKSFYEVESLISEYSEEADIEDRDIFAYIDGNLENVNEFYSKLIHSRQARLRLAKALKANEIFKFVSITKSEISNADELDMLDEDNSGLDSIETLEGFDFDSTNGDDLIGDIDSNEFNTDSDLELSELEDSSDLSELETSDVLETFEQNDDVQSLDLDGESNSEAESQEDIKTSEVDIKNDNLEFGNDDVEPVEESTFENFTTVASPSVENLEDILNEDSNEQVADEIHSEMVQSDVVQEEPSNSEEQIEALFNSADTSEGGIDSEPDGMEVYPQAKQKTSMLKPLAIVALLVVICTGAYFGYTKFSNNTLPDNDAITNNNEDALTTQAIAEPTIDTSQEAMPNENLDVVTTSQAQNEGTATSILAIEQNLDASILVTNLKVDWEVPAGYASNTSVKRYLVKLGKIIQLNLKTELLLLNKPPISNKIAVEIKYNPSSRKFEAANITVSSGEQSVDDVIMQTVNKALAMNLSMNTDSFAKLQGNPVLIIHL